MNEQQRTQLLTSIAISSGHSSISPTSITSQQRSEAFTNLEQFKTYPSRIAICIDMISATTISFNTSLCITTGSVVDVTVSTKLYALSIIKDFLKLDYNNLNVNDRLQLRTSILVAAQQLCTTTSTTTSGNSNNGGESGSSKIMDPSTRILAVKIASLLADLALREFPQRWTTFVTDLFSLWNVSFNKATTGSGGEGGSNNTIGVKICLECLKLITEDCTDSDYNARVSLCLLYAVLFCLIYGDGGALFKSDAGFLDWRVK